MSGNTRRRWYEEGWGTPILPWEKAWDEPRSGNTSEVVEAERRPGLVGPQGQPLTRRRALGFRPEDAK